MMDPGKVLNIMILVVASLIPNIPSVSFSPLSEAKQTAFSLVDALRGARLCNSFSCRRLFVIIKRKRKQGTSLEINAM